MNDFFASLAARVHGTHDAVRPRLPSMFESDGAVQMPSEETTATAPHDEARTASVAPPPAEPPAQRAPLPAADAAPVPSRAPLQVVTERVQAAPAAAAKAAATTAPPVAAAAAVQPPPLPPQRGDGETVRHTEREVIRREVVERHPAPPPEARRAPQSEPPVEPQHKVMPRTERPAPMATLPAQESDDPFAPMASPQRSPAAVTPPAPPVLPRVEPRPQPPQAPVQRRAAAEPAIQVTIGRIEVRATSAPAERRKTAGTPVMSLEDYLRTRGERGRA
ncbi:MAG: hypothetical protein P4L83_05010 [Nevskia sp.]|nr:hypothetical protein [Nevskia sp.]